MRTPAGRSLATTENPSFASSGLSGCDCPASNEMQDKHDYADYQQDVNDTARNVERQEPKQPQNNQSRRN
jgi:hypothetical protein